MNQMPPEAHPGQTPHPPQLYPQQPYPQQLYPLMPHPPPVAPQYPFPSAGVPSYAPTPYMQPGVPLVSPTPRRATNGLAVTTMILGISAVVLSWVPPITILALIGAVVAVILGHVGFSQINQSGNMQGGRGMAIAGFVLGYVAITISVLVIIDLAAQSSR